MTDIPITDDREPTTHKNPRHAVWIDDAKGLRRVTCANPGDEVINLAGVPYQHTRELRPEGPWVYTRVP